MKSESRGVDPWRQPTYGTHNEEDHEACRRILEMDALWRMNDAYESDLYSHDGQDTHVRALCGSLANEAAFVSIKEGEIKRPDR